MRETKNIEFKEKVTATFLKTVSAYANYGTGKIYFGVADDGKAVGISDIKKTCLNIENKINDSIDPVPNYSIEINNKNKTIILTVEEGLHKPYFYNSKAYTRNDSATIEVDRLELTRLILEGSNKSYEELPSKKKDLTYDILSKHLKEALGISKVTTDTLKTLELLDASGKPSIAAELLADKNSMPGIDFVRYGDSISFIKNREGYDHVSIIKLFEIAIKYFERYYRHEEIKGALRKEVYEIPIEAYREAIANALVHRVWDVNTNIHVKMNPVGVEIISVGGLPKGLKEEDFRRGGISILRNRIIGTVFYRLNITEKLGTGIERIMEAYKKSNVKPSFEILENQVRVRLPIIKGLEELSDDENAIYESVKGKCVSSSQVVSETGFGKSKTVVLLKQLTEKGYITSSGVGRGIKYTA